MVEMESIEEVLQYFGRCDSIRRDELDEIAIYGPFCDINGRSYVGIEYSNQRVYVVSDDFSNIKIITIEPDEGRAEIININNNLEAGEFLRRARHELSEIGAYRALEVMAGYMMSKTRE